MRKLGIRMQKNLLQPTPFVGYEEYETMFSYRCKSSTSCEKKKYFPCKSLYLHKRIAMKKMYFLFFVLVLLGGTMEAAGQETDTHAASRIRLREHVTFLASDSLGGRLMGTEGNLIAGEYIAGCFADIGLEEYNGTSYFHYFQVEIPSAVRDVPLAVVEGCNVIGVLPGTHAYLKNEFIVVGAHYDHLGTATGREGAVDTIYNGADDNASGTAALIELAHLLKEQGGLDRTVVFVAFDGEEQGLLGSAKFLEDALFPEHKICVMLSLDMVGYYRKSGVLKVLGTGTLKDVRKWMPRSGNIKVKHISFESSPVSATDTRSFAVKEIPTLFLTTGLVSPYHKVTDHADLIDYDGLAGVAGYTRDLTTALSNYSFLSSSGKYAVIHHVPENSFHVAPSVHMGQNRLIPSRGVLQGKPAFYMSAGADFRFLWRGFLEFGPGLYLEHFNLHHALEVGGSSKNRIQTLALNTPFTCRVYFPEFNKLPVGVYASSSVYYRYYLATRTREPDTDYLSILRRHEGGVGFGLGLRAASFQLGYELKWGISGLFKKDAFEDYNVRNRTQAVVFSYFF